ncbi:MAG: hypothetical protein JNK82_37190 [Myxococcaceae bacterium]|nr:hypothetical protein [Myxococcaceae bacterium]
MMRLYACNAASSLAGCSCFDGAYDAYCADTGKCDERRLELGILPQVEAGRCVSGNISFVNQNGQSESLGRDGSVVIDGGRDVLIFPGTTCNTPEPEVPFDGMQSRVDFAYQTYAHGPHTLEARAEGRVARAGYLATANLRFSETDLVVANDAGSACGEAHQVLLSGFSDDGMSPIAPTRNVALRLSGLDLWGGTSVDACDVNVQGYDVDIPPGQAGVTLFLRSTANRGDLRTLEATVLTDGVGLIGPATLRVHTGCLPSAVGCDAGASCCSGNCAGTCQ